MWINEDMPESRAKMGWYEVGGKRYLNKYHALENCPAESWPTWNFNNEVYSRVDWSQEPQTDLYDL